jgi:prophage maintenance system killer protein
MGAGKNEIVVFQTKNGEAEFRVVLDGEHDTVWATELQIAEIFGRDRTVINRHISNVFKEDELSEKATSAKIAQVRFEGERQITREVIHYNLDVILSVGYRVKSPLATEFRIWATRKLKEYLIQGYAINQKRLEQSNQEVRILRSGIQILSRAIEEKTRTEGHDWLGHFSKGLRLLDDYDHENLDARGLTIKPVHYPTMPEYQKLVDQMKADFESDVFGVKKDQSFESAIGQLSKGFGDDDFYPSIEEKAAMLLYLVIKNHAFTDGNKRIGAACFLLFLETNSALHGSDGTPIISNEALASITLFVAASRPEEMQTVKRLIMSILNRNKN